jgi:hypothetical protein
MLDYTICVKSLHQCDRNGDTKIKLKR